MYAQVKKHQKTAKQQQQQKTKAKKKKNMKQKTNKKNQMGQEPIFVAQPESILPGSIRATLSLF